MASVTKPVTAIALMQLVERGLLSLTDPVQRYIPEFSGPGKELIRVEHLLTHTSGLPDMLPADQVLRERHAQLPEFAEQVCCCDLLFAPGTKVSYQSMGTLMAAEIVERISQRSLREVMATEIFTPLQMTSTSLGLRNDLLPRLNEVLLPEEQLDTSYHWTMAGLGEEDRRHHLWGLGWRLGAWGKRSSPTTFSHGGATGTLVGADPETGLACAVFTTKLGAPLHKVVNAVQAAVVN